MASGAVAAGTFPPGPRPSRLDTLRFTRDPLTFLTDVFQRYGDLASYWMGGEMIWLVSDPQRIKDILVTHNPNFTKSRGLDRAKPLLGNGLLTSEKEVHLRQRRLLQPAFHRERIAAYGGTMAAYADDMQKTWRDGVTVDVSNEMTRLTLSIAGKTLFDVDVQQQASEVGRALTDVMQSFWLTMLPFTHAMEWLPIGPMARARRARERLDRLIYSFIADRRAHPSDRGDLLSMLLLAQDEDDGSVMTDVQVRDEAMTIFLAGHETTANALTWIWYLLSQSPDSEAKLHAELDRVLQGRLPTMADLPSLPFVEQVVAEAMRLYPPAWVVGRRAIDAYPIGGYVAPPRSIFLMSQWVMHRDARFFPNPDRFHPDRWTPEFKAALPKFAYFPFGGGPRQCIGESFAWMELVLVVATLAQQWTFALAPGHRVVPQPIVTLRAKGGMTMTLRSRVPQGA
jgi:cytochrome P450